MPFSEAYRINLQVLPNLFIIMALQASMQAVQPTHSICVPLRISIACRTNLDALKTIDAITMQYIVFNGLFVNFPWVHHSCNHKPRSWSSGPVTHSAAAIRTNHGACLFPEISIHSIKDPGENQDGKQAPDMPRHRLCNNLLQCPHANDIGKKYIGNDKRQEVEAHMLSVFLTISYALSMGAGLTDAFVRRHFLQWHIPVSGTAFP